MEAGAMGMREAARKTAFVSVAVSVMRSLTPLERRVVESRWMLGETQANACRRLEIEVGTYTEAFQKALRMLRTGGQPEGRAAVLA